MLTLCTNEPFRKSAKDDFAYSKQLNLGQNRKEQCEKRRKKKCSKQTRTVLPEPPDEDSDDIQGFGQVSIGQENLE
jgi:hypothetical protein